MTCAPWLSRGEGADGYLRELTGYLHSAISHFVRMDAPVIAAVNGTAAGAGVGWSPWRISPCAAAAPSSASPIRVLA